MGTPARMTRSLSRKKKKLDTESSLDPISLDDCEISMKKPIDTPRTYSYRKRSKDLEFHSPGLTCRMCSIGETKKKVARLSLNSTKISPQRRSSSQGRASPDQEDPQTKPDSKLPLSQPVPSEYSHQDTSDVIFHSQPEQHKYVCKKVVNPTKIVLQKSQRKIVKQVDSLCNVLPSANEEMIIEDVNMLDESPVFTNAPTTEKERDSSNAATAEPNVDDKAIQRSDEVKNEVQISSPRSSSPATELSKDAEDVEPLIPAVTPQPNDAISSDDQQTESIEMPQEGHCSQEDASDMKIKEKSPPKGDSGFKEDKDNINGSENIHKSLKPDDAIVLLRKSDHVVDVDAKCVVMTSESQPPSHDYCHGDPLVASTQSFTPMSETCLTDKSSSTVGLEPTVITSNPEKLIESPSGLPDSSKNTFSVQTDDPLDANDGIVHEVVIPDDQIPFSQSLEVNPEGDLSTVDAGDSPTKETSHPGPAYTTFHGPFSQKFDVILQQLSADDLAENLPDSSVAVSNMECDGSLIDEPSAMTASMADRCSPPHARHDLMPVKSSPETCGDLFKKKYDNMNEKETDNSGAEYAVNNIDQSDDLSDSQLWLIDEMAMTNASVEEANGIPEPAVLIPQAAPPVQRHFPANFLTGIICELRKLNASVTRAESQLSKKQNLDRF